MCAVSGMDPPCSKCGAPVRWRYEQERMLERIERLTSQLDTERAERQRLEAGILDMVQKHAGGDDG